MKNYINRSLYPLLEKSLTEKYISILLGPRQTGKTTLLKNLVENMKTQGVTEKDILFLNFDNPNFRTKILGQPDAFFQELEQNFGEKLSGLSSKKYLFLDEAQKLPEIFDLLKILFDTYPEKIKIFVSGSSSLHLIKRTSETLVGRARLYYLAPFSWQEILFSQIEQNPLSLIDSILDDSFSEEKYLQIQAPIFRQKESVHFSFNQYLLNGGLPEFFFITDEEKRVEALGNYLKIYLEQEIRFLPQIGDENLFLQALQIFLLRDSQILNFSKLASEIGIQRLTLKKYQTILEETFLLNSLYPYISQSKQAIKSPKTYFFDHGLINFSKKDFDLSDLWRLGNAGFILENITINNTLRHFANNPRKNDLNFWRDYAGHEIDLIISTQNNRVLPIEITSAKNCDRQKFNNFHAFYKLFPEANDGIILYQGEFKKIALGKKSIYAIPCWMWF